MLLLLILNMTFRYGQLERETNPLCEGVCPAGYYCPVGTSYPFVKPCGGSVVFYR